MNQIVFEDVYAEAYVRESIEVILKNVTEHYPMLESEMDDIKQDLLIALSNKIGCYQPERCSLNHYARIVLDSAIKKILRKMFARKRVFERLAVRDGVLLDRTPEIADNPMSRLELALDVQVVVSILPKTEQTICRLIMQGIPFVTICRETHISTATLYTEYFPRLRRVFEEFGFDKNQISAGK
ncbi:MAG: hypothetical protein PHS41_09680 [Victivallaceae bacterium]|nr:hypothetical protein [Victivallaceae bacterium]